jgi:hypothetical protein
MVGISIVRFKFNRLVIVRYRVFVIFFIFLQTTLEEFFNGFIRMPCLMNSLQGDSLMEQTSITWMTK